MHSLKCIEGEENLSYLFAEARQEYDRRKRREGEFLECRTTVLIEYWFSEFKSFIDDYSQEKNIQCELGRLIDDFRDLETGLRFEGAPQACRIFVSCVLVVLCRVNPRYSPPSLLPYIRYLILTARKGKDARLVNAIVAVVRGNTVFEKRFKPPNSNNPC